jgi:drug/metabolite transporter (DMT)-like permease
MHTDNPRGIAAMTAAMAAFAINDALMKLASEALPVAQTIFVRGALVTVLLFAMAWARGALAYWYVLFKPSVLARGILETSGSFGYLIALAHIPLATALAINMATPLVMMPFAVLLLGEDIRWRRWATLVVGFVGVLLVMRPGPDGINWWVLLSFATTFAFALRDVHTRRIAVGIPSILVTAGSAAMFALTAGLVVAFDGWQPIPVPELLELGAAAILVGVGMHLLVIATRVGEASVIAGFRYTALVWGVVIGYFVWGHLPDPPGWAGIGLVVGAGLYAAHRERVRRLEKAAG